MTVFRLTHPNQISARRGISLGGRIDRSDSGVNGVDVATGNRGTGDPTRPEHSGNRDAASVCVRIRLEL